MPKSQALYLQLCAATVAFCLVFMLPAFVPISVLWYYPLEHRWALQLRAEGLAMDWFGRLLWALLAGGAGFALAKLGTHFRKADAGQLLGVWTAWLTTAVLLTLAVYSYQLALRHPVPAPLPAWYQPK